MADKLLQMLRVVDQLKAFKNPSSTPAFVDGPDGSDIVKQLRELLKKQCAGEVLENQVCFVSRRMHLY
jgi:hypothetical protein